MWRSQLEPPLGKENNQEEKSKVLIIMWSSFFLYIHTTNFPLYRSAKEEAFKQWYVSNTSQVRSRSTTKFNLTILWITTLFDIYTNTSPSVTSATATHTPSLAATDDGMPFPSNESTTSSNRGMSGSSMSILLSWELMQCHVVTSDVWQILPYIPVSVPLGSLSCIL